MKIKINSFYNNNNFIISFIKTDFWYEYKKIIDQVIILYIISVIEYDANIYYYKIFYWIPNFSKILAETLIYKKVNTKADIYKLIYKKI